MKTVAIVKVVWIATVFSTSALVSQALIDSENPGPIVFEPNNSASSDAGAQAPGGYAAVADNMIIVSSYWDSAL